MKTIVQKFGGTSTQNKESRKLCYAHIKNELDRGYKVIVVVSAMGRTGEPYATDTLIKLAPSINPREKDLLMNTGELISACIFSSELNEIGVENKILSGGQAGIITNNLYNQAGIIDLRPERLIKELETTDIIIVTGFQGCTITQELTTLGRGGSDTSATALGAAVGAEYVDIYTDVEGIMTADPRIVEDAQILNKTTYNEICNLAYMGAKVIHPRAVEIAMQYNIPVRVRSTFSKSEGTLISNHTELDLTSHKQFGQTLIGITQTGNIAQFIVDCKSSYSVQNDLFTKLENAHISLDLINITREEVCFTVKKDNLKIVSEILSSFKLKYAARDDVTKISLVGSSMAGVPGVVRKIVSTLYEKNIPILQTTDSHTTIWVLVPDSDSIKAIKSLHKSFGLNKVIKK